MKAKEYAELLFEDIKKANDNSDIDRAIGTILSKFMVEGQELAKVRNVELDSGMISIIKEQSDKWAAFGRIVNKKYGILFIRLDGFKNYVISKIPELKDQI